MKAGHAVRRNVNDLYFMHWFVWLVCFISRKKNKRNWHSQSAWRIGATYCYNAFNRFYQVSCNCFSDCITSCIYGCKQMVAEFSLSYCNKLVAVCIGRNISDVDCVVYDKFSINKSSHSKPCKELENGMIIFINNGYYTFLQMKKTNKLTIVFLIKSYSLQQEPSLHSIRTWAIHARNRNIK